MRRGDLVTVAVQGDFGKSRPALVIQSDAFNETHATVTVLLISSDPVAAPLFRLTVEPSEENGLRKTCQVMVDKTMTVKKEKIGKVFGRLDDKTLLEVARAVAVFLGIAP